MLSMQFPRLMIAPTHPRHACIHVSHNIKVVIIHRKFDVFRLQSSCRGKTNFHPTRGGKNPQTLQPFAKRQHCGVNLSNGASAQPTYSSCIIRRTSCRSAKVKKSGKIVRQIYDSRRRPRPRRARRLWVWLLQMRWNEKLQPFPECLQSRARGYDKIRTMINPKLFVSVQPASKFPPEQKSFLAVSRG